VVDPSEPEPIPKSAVDALLASYRTRGCIDIQYMENIYGKSEDEMVKELDGVVFRDPDGALVSAEEYLSGNVRAKLLRAIEAAEKDHAFDPHVKALQKVQPTPLEIDGINPKTGANWIPPDVYREFIGNLFEVDTDQAPSIHFSTKSGVWTVNDPRHSLGMATANTEVYGVTSHEGQHVNGATFFELLRHALNGTAPEIWQGSGKDRTKWPEGTQVARTMLQSIKETFKDWIYADPERAHDLAEHYNNTVNVYAGREHDGSHLTFPGKNPALIVRGSQADAVWRILVELNTYIAHGMGGGKTFLAILAAMEAKRMGLKKKILHVTEGNNLLSYANSFLYAYPDANILVADDYNFDTDRRREFLARIATGDWDSIIMTQSSFRKLPVHRDTVTAFYGQMIADLREALDTIEREGGETFTVKQIEGQIEKLQLKLESGVDRLSATQDTNITWEELGVDMLIIDEAHKYKNLYVPSKNAQLNLTGNDTTIDALMKIRSIQNRNQGGGVVLMSGTPVTNSIAEVHSIFRYIAPKVLDELGVSNFDVWANTFGEPTSDVERNVAGAYVNVTRFKSFDNVPELKKQLFSFLDLVRTEDIVMENGEKIPLPPLTDRKGNITGKVNLIELDPTPEQDAYWRNFTARYAAARMLSQEERKQPGADTELRISGDGNMTSIDIRFRVPDAPDRPNSKINVAAGNVYDIWKEHRADKRTQLVFIDAGVPTKEKKTKPSAPAENTGGEFDTDAEQDAMESQGGRYARFDLYNDFKARLVKLGIPEPEIQFAQTPGNKAQQEELYEKVRRGDVTVLVGTAAKMGVGVNVQDRVIAGHFFNPYWTPAEYMQAVARIVRFGNEFNDHGVQLYQYLTKNSPEQIQFRRNGDKLGYIETMFSHDMTTRSIGDVDAGKKAYDPDELEAITSGNPHRQKYLNIKRDFENLERLKRRHDSSLIAIRGKLASVRNSVIPNAEARVKKLEGIIPEATSAKDNLKLKIGGGLFTKGTTYTDKKEAATALQELVAEWEHLR
ncbi:MAG: helicase-related protein, partial [Armatimonadota bacterium]